MAIVTALQRMVGSAIIERHRVTRIACHRLVTRRNGGRDGGFSFILITVTYKIISRKLCVLRSSLRVSDTMFARLAKQVCSVKGGAAVVGLVVSIPAVGQSLVFAHAESKSEFDRHKVLIIGGGTAGTTVANQLSKKVISAMIKSDIQLAMF